jgi:putative aldouronate transport system substrate-binding protein
MRKKIVTPFLAGTLALLLGACGSTGPQTAAPAPQAAAPPAANKHGLVPMADAGTPITYSIFVRDPGTAPAADNPILQEVRDLTGVTLEFEFLVGDLEQKIGVMLAGGVYPDIIMGGGARYVEGGAMIPLEDRLPAYPNLMQQYGPYIDHMKTAFNDGHVYYLEIYAVEQHESPLFQNGNAGFYIQKDVLAEAGYVNPKTLDEYFDLIERYKNKHPEINGVKTIGFEILTDGWRSFCLRNPAMHLLGNSNQGDVYVDYATHTASYYQISDSAKNYYRKLNQMYHKGLIEAETLTQNYDQYIARMSTGAVLGMFDQRWNFASAENLIYADGQYAHTYVSVPIADPGVEPVYLDAKNPIPTGAGGVGITTNCKNPERLMAFWDWLIQREVQDYLNWGVEGVDYIAAEGGDKYLTPQRLAIAKDVALNRDKTAATLLNYTPKRQGLYEDGTPCTPGDSAAQYFSELSAYDQDFLQKFNIKYQGELLNTPYKHPSYFPVWNFIIEDASPAAIAKAKLESLGMKHYPQLILCAPEEYDAKWDAFLKDWRDAGVGPYLDEVNRIIQEKLKQQTP